MIHKLSPDDAERLIGSVEGLRSQFATSAVLILDPARPAVLWANRRAAQVFGTDQQRELEARLFRPGHPASAGLRARLARLRPGEPPSLERLTPGDPLRSEPMVFSVVSLGRQEGCTLVALTAAGRYRSEDDLSYVSALSVGPTADPEMREPADAAREAVPKVGGFDVPGGGSKGRRSVRLLWEASRDGTITRCDPRFAATLGTAALEIGDNLVTRLAAFDPAAGEDVAAALAACWNRSAMHVAWPFQDVAVPTDIGFICRLGGARGFCVFDLTDVDAPVAIPAAGEPIVVRDIQPPPVETALDAAALDRPPPSAVG